MQSLQNNWGEKAEALACKALLRLFDPMSCWECFIIAQNPQDEDEVYCILHAETVEVCTCSLKELLSMYNSEGEQIQRDSEYRPRLASEIYRQLTEYDYYDPKTD